MIRLSVAHYQIINLRHINDFFQFFQILVKEFCFRRLEQNDLISGLHHI